MIRIFLGNLGSGKSISAVREMYHDNSGRKTYTNILTRGLGNVVHIKPEYVVKKIRNGKKISYDLNVDYWQGQKKPLNVLWDEIHLTANSRMSSSKVNMVLSRFIAMARRITGFDKRGYGHFTFIAQKDRTIDVNIKELANEVVFHISHWIVRCEDCGARISVNSEMQVVDRCLCCGSWKILRENLSIEIIRFSSWSKYFLWSEDKKRHYYERFFVKDVRPYFKCYDTMQMTDIWDKYVNSEDV